MSLPTGRVTQVAGAAFNGAHRESAYEPRELEAGEIYELEIELHFTSWVFSSGHRIRLAINNSQWPMLWPSRYPMTTTLHLGGEAGSRLELPIIPVEERPVPAFLPPAEDPELPGYESTRRRHRLGLWRDRHGRAPRCRARYDQSWRATAAGPVPVGHGALRGEDRPRADDDNPAETELVGEHRITVEIDGRTLTWEAALDFRSDLESFFYTYTRRLLENGELVREKTWIDTIPRDHQ